MPNNKQHITFKVETESEFRRRRWAKRLAAVVMTAGTLVAPAITAGVAPVVCVDTHLC